MKKINRKRKRILHRYKFLRFRKCLIEKMCEMLSDEIDKAIINGMKDHDTEYYKEFKKTVERGIETWPHVKEN